ncbi:MAG: type II toxin-antitoxin system VapC family toxin [Terracidiphilus sp.]|jgi:ribonuclease VapC
MILDTSAIIAILQYEPEAAGFAQAVEKNRPVRVSAANWLEAAVVVDGNRSLALSRSFNQFLREAQVEIEPVTAHKAELAREAYRAFGRGSGHRAHLNFGDCFAYALAVDRDEPLLFKGRDFASTDVRRVPMI